MSKARHIPYGRQTIDEDDVAAVREVLLSDWLTTGPSVAGFEQAVTEYVGAAHGVAVCNGTAALHAAFHALGVGPGDEVIVPPLTFAATANSVVYNGAMPVFADVNADNLLLDPVKAEEKITKKTKAIVAVDYAGHPCDWDTLRSLADQHGLFLVDDACHALGAEYKGRRIGTMADITAFSFHPVKHVATGEGGMIVTDNEELDQKARRFRHHGISVDHHQRAAQGSWYYEIRELGYNYRLSDIHCALGISQMKKLARFLERRREIAARYDQAFKDMEQVSPLRVQSDVAHAYHLYVIQLAEGLNRVEVFERLRQAGIGAAVHYMPVHLHPFYVQNFSTEPGLCPTAEAAYERIISLPMFPGLDDAEVDFVIEQLRGIVLSLEKQ
jgi:perosamine synthetase